MAGKALAKLSLAALGGVFSGMVPGIATGTLAEATPLDRGRGDRIVEVYGADLATARHVAIIVPGADTTAATFETHGGKPYSAPGGGARALVAEARRLDPAARLAVVAWLGYDTPRTLSLRAATDGAAVAGAPELRRTVAAVRSATGAPISLLCHSYGSVLCAKALPGLPVADVAVFGSPGLGVARAAELRSPARLWAGRARGDWVRFVPSVRIGPLGFGADPTAPAFGARVFAAGSGGHGDYLKPGGVALRNLALIALGRGGEVTRG